MRMPERLEQARHEILAARRIGAEQQTAQTPTRRTLRLALALRPQRQHALRIRQQRTPRLRKLHTVAAAAEERRPQLGLKRRHPSAERRLRQVKCDGGAREAARPRDMQKRVELIEGHRASRSHHGRHSYRGIR